uniref:RING-type domain-containing protein n=1 Tax=Amphimedon queenslandica TaxID=400682 RepID=A0A1X7U560_AMPQE
MSSVVEPVPHCPLCTDRSPSNNFKLLPCQHSYCERCLEELLLLEPDGHSYVLACPSCRFPVSLASDGILGLPTIEPRGGGGGGGKEERRTSSSSIGPVCSRHDKVIQLYCETCLSTVCQSCAVEDHGNHLYYQINRSQSKHREEVRGGLKDIENKRNQYRSSLSKVREREEEVKRRSDEIQAEIESLAERLTQLVEESKNNLLKELTSIKEKKLRVLLDQRTLGEERLVEIERVSESLEQFLSIESNQQFLSQKKTMMELIDRVNTGSGLSDFEPNERNDIKFKGSGSLLVLNKTIGEIGGTLLHQYCSPTVTSSASIVTANSTTIFHLKLKSEDRPISVSTDLFSCKLLPPYEAPPIDCVIKEACPGEYCVNMKPTSEGLHKLSIKINDCHINRSPFTIPVAPATSGLSTTIIPNVHQPWGVAVGGANNEYLLIAESGTHVVSLYQTSTGSKLRAIGGKGKEDGKFTDPRGVAITPTNQILVTDYDRVQKLTVNGGCVRSVCGKGSGALQFQEPKGITCSNNRILIADTKNHRIQVLNNDWSYCQSFGADVLRFPWDVTCDEDGYAYVVDNDTHNVFKFDHDGKFKMKFGSKGSGPGQLQWPAGISYSRDHLYITDDNNRVSIFDTTGSFIRHITLDKGDAGNTGTMEEDDVVCLWVADKVSQS